MVCSGWCAEVYVEVLAAVQAAELLAVKLLAGTQASRAHRLAHLAAATFRTLWASQLPASAVELVLKRNLVVLPGQCVWCHFCTDHLFVLFGP